MDPSPIWIPRIRAQVDACLCQADELHFGGQAGGGKSHLLLGLALTAHRRSIIFRREYKQLLGAEGLIEESRTLLNHTDARYNGQEMIWRDIPGDRVLEFGAVQLPNDVNKYQGRPHDLVAFDELPHFLESQYRYLTAWCRTTIPGQRCRVVSTGNPPLTPEGMWIVKRWGAWLDSAHPNPAEPGELRWYAQIDDDDIEVEDGTPIEHKGETIQPRSRTFIPARLEDNPFLAESGYRSVLQSTPEPMRSKLLFGDYGIGFQDHRWQIIPSQWVVAAQKRWGEKFRAGQIPGTVLSLGADVGGGSEGGDDYTIAAVAPGAMISYVTKWQPPSPDTATMDFASELREEIVRTRAPLYIDAIGVGLGAYNRLRELKMPAYPFMASYKTAYRDASGRYGFANWRAAGWWILREMLDPQHGVDLALPPDRELLGDLTTPRYSVNSRSEIVVEEKEQIRKRLRRSPNMGDAVMHAIAGPPLFREYQAEREEKVVYDPVRVGRL